MAQVLSSLPCLPAGGLPLLCSKGLRSGPVVCLPLRAWARLVPIPPSKNPPPIQRRIHIDADIFVSKPLGSARPSGRQECRHEV